MNLVNQAKYGVIRENYPVHADILSDGASIGKPIIHPFMGELARSLCFGNPAQRVLFDDLGERVEKLRIGVQAGCQMIVCWVAATLGELLAAFITQFVQCFQAVGHEAGRKHQWTFDALLMQCFENVVRRRSEPGFWPETRLKTTDPFVIAPTHVLAPEVPLENIAAFVEAAKEYGGWNK